MTDPRRRPDDIAAPSQYATMWQAADPRNQPSGATLASGPGIAADPRIKSEAAVVATDPRRRNGRPQAASDFGSAPVSLATPVPLAQAPGNDSLADVKVPADAVKLEARVKTEAHGHMSVGDSDSHPAYDFKVEELEESGDPLLLHPIDRPLSHASWRPDEAVLLKQPLSFVYTHNRPIECEAAFDLDTSKRLQQLVGSTLRCDVAFNCNRVHAMCVLHILNRGEPPFLRLRPFPHASSQDAFKRAVSSLLSSPEDPPLPVAMLRDGDENTEIVFVPFHERVVVTNAAGQRDSELRPCFWGYRVVPGTLCAAIVWLYHNRMPVVFDLDDTLVVATSEAALKDRRDKNKAAVKTLEAQLMLDETDDSTRRNYEKRVTLLKKETSFVEADLRMLREYVDLERVTDDAGVAHEAQYEPVLRIDGTTSSDNSPGGSGTKPVVRILEEDYLTVFTRINPLVPSTSMIIRVRPGWSSLKAELLSTTAAGNATRKWDTFFCTAAEQSYALEVCRLLDPAGDLVPHRLLKNHLVCVSRDNKKSLRAALHHPIDVYQYKSAESQGMEDADDIEGDNGINEDETGAADVPTMSAAIIVDDRTDVWELDVQEQIVSATPFQHYPSAAKAALGEDVSHTIRGQREVQRMLLFLRGIRQDLFHFLHHCLMPTVQVLLHKGFPAAFATMDMHALFSASPYVNINSMQPSVALPRDAVTRSKVFKAPDQMITDGAHGGAPVVSADAVVKAAEEDDVPVDPRKLQPSSAPAGYGEPAPITGTPPSFAPNEPAGTTPARSMAQPGFLAPSGPWTTSQPQLFAPGGALDAMPSTAPLPLQPTSVAKTSVPAAALPLPPGIPFNLQPVEDAQALPGPPDPRGARGAPAADARAATSPEISSKDLEKLYQAGSGDVAAPSAAVAAAAPKEVSPASSSGMDLEPGVLTSRRSSYEELYGSPMTVDNDAHFSGEEEGEEDGLFEGGTTGDNQPAAAAGAVAGAHSQGAVPEQDTATMLKELGQEGLPFVVVKREAGAAGGPQSLRAVRVQQNPPISGFAPFVAHGQIIPVIAVDPDVSKRPEVIVIRVTPEQMQHKVPVQANYHHLLQQQRNYQFPSDQGIVTLPPWLMLDTDALLPNSRRPPTADLAGALAAQTSPYPPVFESDFLSVAMDSLHSFYLRRPVPDMPSGSQITVPDAKTPMPPPSLDMSLREVVGAPAPEGHTYAAISLPRAVVQRIQATPSHSGRHSVQAPDGAHIVQAVQMRVGDDGATATTCVELKALAARTAPPNAAHAPSLPGANQKAAAAAPPSDSRKRKATTDLDTSAEASNSTASPSGSGYVGPGYASAGLEAARGPLADGDPLGGVNPISMLYQHGQVNSQQVHFDSGRQLDTKEGKRMAWELHVRLGNEIVGTGQGKTKKDAKRAAALRALEYLEIVPPGTAMAMLETNKPASTYVSASGRHAEAGTSTSSHSDDGTHTSSPRERSPAYDGPSRADPERSSRKEGKRARHANSSDPNAANNAPSASGAHAADSTTAQSQPRYQGSRGAKAAATAGYGAAAAAAAIASNRRATAGYGASASTKASASPWAFFGFGGGAGKTRTAATGGYGASKAAAKAAEGKTTGGYGAGTLASNSAGLAAANDAASAGTGGNVAARLGAMLGTGSKGSGSKPKVETILSNGERAPDESEEGEFTSEDEG